MDEKSKLLVWKDFLLDIGVGVEFLEPSQAKRIIMFIILILTNVSRQKINYELTHQPHPSSRRGCFDSHLPGSSSKETNLFNQIYGFR